MTLETVDSPTFAFGPVVSCLDRSLGVNDIPIPEILFTKAKVNDDNFY